MVFVDDEKVLERRVSGTQKHSILGIKFHEGRLHEVVDVKPGRRTVTVQVSWDQSERRQAIAGTFNEGMSRHLVAQLEGISKDLSLEWQ